MTYSEHDNQKKASKMDILWIYLAKKRKPNNPKIPDFESDFAVLSAVELCSPVYPQSGHNLMYVYKWLYNGGGGETADSCCFF